MESEYDSLRRHRFDRMIAAATRPDVVYLALAGWALHRADGGCGQRWSFYLEMSYENWRHSGDAIEGFSEAEALKAVVSGAWRMCKTCAKWSKRRGLECPPT